MLTQRKLRILLLALGAACLILWVFSGKEEKIAPPKKPRTPLKKNFVADNSKEDTVQHIYDKDKEVKQPTEPKVELKEEPDLNTSDFDARAEFNLIRSMAPMTIFSKSYCPFSKRAKSLFNDHYEIIPKPQIVELDLHQHGQELQDYVARVTNRRTVPNIIVGEDVQSRGGADDMMSLHNDGTLLGLLNTWGKGSLVASKKEPPSNA